MKVYLRKHQLISDIYQIPQCILQQFLILLRVLVRNRHIRQPQIREFRKKRLLYTYASLFVSLTMSLTASVWIKSKEVIYRNMGNAILEDCILPNNETLIHECIAASFTSDLVARIQSMTFI